MNKLIKLTLLLSLLSACLALNCDPNPCKNNGKCKLDDKNGIKCECEGKFTGPFCQLEFHPEIRLIENKACSENPCKNDASCVPLFNDEFYCTCKDGFGGKTCEIEDPCKNNPCKNGGTCQPTSMDPKEPFFCLCLKEYTGSTCELDNPCNKNPCLNNGKCSLDKNGDVECECESGYKGNLCEISISPCSEGICKNDGICVPKSNNEYSCVCLPGFTGNECEEKDPCQLNPCKNEAECRSFKAGSEWTYSCDCPSLFYGNNCEKKNPCGSSPCKNNGLCVLDRESNKAKCHCINGYSGEFCTESNECKDGYSSCSSLSQFGFCNLISNFCKKSCKKC